MLEDWVRERALAKIKSRADCQEELVRLLKTEAAPEVLGFLSANEVDDPATFVAAVPEGLLQQALEIRRGPAHPANHVVRQRALTDRIG